MLSRGPIARLLAALAPVAIGGLLSCGTVDPGPPTGPPMGCNGSPDFFVSDVWPSYLDKFSCGKSDCHNEQSGHGYFRLRTDGNGRVMNAPPPPGQPRSMWPEDWQFNYSNAARLLNCSDPTGSLLLAVPEGRAQPHPGGNLIVGADVAPAEMVFQTWGKRP